jgi:uncharacterized membrane protein
MSGQWNRRQRKGKGGAGNGIGNERVVSGCSRRHQLDRATDVTSTDATGRHALNGLGHLHTAEVTGSKPVAPTTKVQVNDLVAREPVLVEPAWAARGPRKRGPVPADTDHVDPHRTWRLAAAGTFLIGLEAAITTFAVLTSVFVVEASYSLAFEEPPSAAVRTLAWCALLGTYALCCLAVVSLWCPEPLRPGSLERMTWILVGLVPVVLLLDVVWAIGPDPNVFLLFGGPLLLLDVAVLGLYRTVRNRQRP